LQSLASRTHTSPDLPPSLSNASTAPVPSDYGTPHPFPSPTNPVPTLTEGDYESIDLLQGTENDDDIDLEEDNEEDEDEIQPEGEHIRRGDSTSESGFESGPLSEHDALYAESDRLTIMSTHEQAILPDRMDRSETVQLLNQSYSSLAPSIRRTGKMAWTQSRWRVQVRFE
jgi:hypothetical protein